MNMKKLMAGVVAGALAVTSLATVGVFAEDTVKTYNFVGIDGNMTIDYSQTVAFKGGVERSDLFKATADPTEYVFDYDIVLANADGYDNQNLSGVNDVLKAAMIKSNGTTITVKGQRENSKKELVDATVTVTTVLDKTSDDEMFRVRSEEDTEGPTLKTGDLDLTDFKKITSISFKAQFNVNTGNYYVPVGAVKVKVTNNLKFESKKASIETVDASYKSERKDATAVEVKADTNYAFEGVAGQTITLVDYGDDESVTGWREDNVKAISLGHNLLRWTNDNIEQNKGAKLRINFLTPEEKKNAIEKGSLSQYTTLDEEWMHWTGANVLVPETTGGTAADDITIGVNLQNTTRLQQSTKIENYTAEFDWDTLVKNSVSTVSGNVDSIAFRLNGKSSTVSDFVAKYGAYAVKSIEVVIPDQSTVPGTEASTELTLSSNGVSATATVATITGNGGKELNVQSTLTDSAITYELHLYAADGTTAVQPAGEVTLKLAIPEKFKGLDLSSDKVSHKCNDGTVEQLDVLNMDTYKTDGFVICKTTKFSGFTLEFDVPEDTTTEAPAVSEETTTEAPAADTQPADDGNQPTGVALAVIPAIVAAAGIVISKKRG